MTYSESIKRHCRSFGNISRRLTIVKNIDLFDLTLVDKGILLIYARWSGPALLNFALTAKLLDKLDYQGKILIIDIDLMSTDFQLKTFGQLCQGWSEIFVIKDGQITQSFIGSNAYKIFANYVDKYNPSDI